MSNNVLPMPEDVVEATKILCRAGAHFACFGSRETPQQVLDLMERLGTALVIHGGYVRSGHCQGADQAFERGAAAAWPQHLVVCLPWRSYEKNKPIDQDAQVVVFEDLPSERKNLLESLASQHHPVWGQLSSPVRKLMARNMLIAENVSAGFCYLNHQKKGGGGSGQCFRYLTSKKVNVFDFSVRGIFHLWDEVANQLLGQ